MHVLMESGGVPSCLRNGTQYLFWSILGPILLPSVVRRFLRSAERVETVNDAVGFAYSYADLGVTITPLQIRSEIQRLVEIVEALNPEGIVEIGTAKGGTLFMFTRVSSPSACIISVDLPEWTGAGGYPDWVSPLYSSFGRKGQALHLVRGDSHDARTFVKVMDLLEGRAVDLLLIDGDHSYEGVKKDFEMYGSLVKQGGMIAFHDVCPGPERSVGGAPVFWNELAGRYKNLMIVGDQDQQGYGIGVLFV